MDTLLLRNVQGLHCEIHIGTSTSHPADLLHMFMTQAGRLRCASSAASSLEAVGAAHEYINRPTLFRCSFKHSGLMLGKANHHLEPGLPNNNAAQRPGSMGISASTNVRSASTDVLSDVSNAVDLLTFSTAWCVWQPKLKSRYRQRLSKRSRYSRRNLLNRPRKVMSYRAPS